MTVASIAIEEVLLLLKVGFLVLLLILMNSHIVSTLVHPLTRFFLHLAG